jgi:hypothetical protein
MKKISTVLASLIVAALFVGCATSTKLNDVHIGMPKADVIALLGTPDSTSAQANVEYLTYYLLSDSGYGRDQPYMIRLVDGKVESFGREFQLYDLYNRPVTSAAPGTPGFPPPGNATTIVQPGATDIATQLEKLKELHDQGVLTDQEFQTAKERLLGGNK